jgi:hypothetical protein
LGISIPFFVSLHIHAKHSTFDAFGVQFGAGPGWASINQAKFKRMGFPKYILVNRFPVHVEGVGFGFDRSHHYIGSREFLGNNDVLV